VGEPGAKNIRSGPGTNFSAPHIAYPGDRVKITDSSSDSGGYLWYKVYFPNSGAEGWIAAQLVQRD
jgi:serine/threonine-protein kinase